MSPIRIFRGLSLVMLLGGATGTASAWTPETSIGCGASCPARIPDRNGATNGQVSINFTVPGGLCAGGTFAGYAVDVDILHSHIGDLSATLVSPSVQTVQLLNPLSGGVCAGDDINSRFRDGTGSSTAVCGNFIPAVAGVITPASSLSALGSTVATGAWHITVTDSSHGGDGQITDAALVIRCSYSDEIFFSGFGFD
ncbi:MAG: proprotein convertase P-domain-containing protein [Dokdonella sp.]